MSWPARANRPPIIPPMGPVPITIMRIEKILLNKLSERFHSYAKSTKAVNSFYYHPRAALADYLSSLS
jgi:hypothetical protein